VDRKGSHFSWLETSVMILQTDNFTVALSENKGVWLKPQKWNQGGYDAVYISKCSSLIRFVQVARGNTHSFKIEYFSSLLWVLSNSDLSFVIKSLEIFFVVEKEKLSSFELSTVTGMGLLSAFPGWEKGKEKNLVQVACVDRLNL
jgi:hypothetical protein